MSEHQTYQGACHCGRVSFELNGKVSRAMRCTCSICSKIGALWHGTTDEGLRIIKGQDDLASYQFNTKTANHYFCKHCGIHTFSRPRIDPSKWVVNLRCVEGIDVDSLPVSVFDGADWENAARAFIARQRGASAA